MTGTTFVRQDNTVELPDWVSRFSARWGIGPVMLSYQAYYLGSVKARPDATVIGSCRCVRTWPTRPGRSIGDGAGDA